VYVSKRRFCLREVFSCIHCSAKEESTHSNFSGKSSWVPILYIPVSVPSRFLWFLCPPSSSTCSKKSLSYFRWPLTGVIWHPICIGLSQAREWFFYKTCIKQATAPTVLVCKWALRLLRVPWTPWRSNQSILKGNQSQIFIERTGAEAEAPILWTLDAKNWLTGKDPDAGKDWAQGEKGTTDEMVG